MLAAILFIGGPILALLFRSWGAGALVFGAGAAVYIMPPMPPIPPMPPPPAWA